MLRSALSALKEIVGTAQFTWEHLCFKSDNQYTHNHKQLSLLTTDKQKLLVNWLCEHQNAAFSKI